MKINDSYSSNSYSETSLATIPGHLPLEERRRRTQPQPQGQSKIAHRGGVHTFSWPALASSCSSLGAWAPALFPNVFPWRKKEFSSSYFSCLSQNRKKTKTKVFGENPQRKSRPGVIGILFRYCMEAYFYKILIDQYFSVQCRP